MGEWDVVSHLKLLPAKTKLTTTLSRFQKLLSHCCNINVEFMARFYCHQLSVFHDTSLNIIEKDLNLTPIDQKYSR